MKQTLGRILFIGFLLGLSACQGDPDPNIQAAVDEVRSEYAPDRRVAVFDVDGSFSNREAVLTGESNLPVAIETLISKLETEGITVRNEIKVLPDTSLGSGLWAVVNNSVANIRSDPGHSAELSTQALLGTPLNILKRERGFFYVQTPDGYLGWVDSGGIERLDRTSINVYREAPKIIFTETYGFAYAVPGQDTERVADLVAGSLLEYDAVQSGFYAVKFPDGRRAFVSSSEAMPFQIWLDSEASSREALIQTAFEFQGTPYLWGGTSAKGMDCSGFTKTVYFLNGMILPRDASQQVRVGEEVDSDGDFSNLEVGDLLFFGTPASDDSPERVVHVGMWIGNNEYIHSSGRVMVNSMDPEAENFDEYNRKRYLRTKRVLSDLRGVHLLDQDGLYASIATPASF